MADLSDLLGDVYGTEETPIRSQPTPTGEGAVPSWADEARLDGFFAGWLPAPTEEAAEPDPETAEDAYPEWSVDVVDDEDEAEDPPDEAEPYGAEAEAEPYEARVYEVEPYQPQAYEIEPYEAQAFEVEAPFGGLLGPDAEPVHPFEAAGGANDARLSLGGRLDDDLAETLSAALAAAPIRREMADTVAVVHRADGLEPAAPVDEPVIEVPARPWQRSDDDLLPGRAGRRGFRRR